MALHPITDEERKMNDPKAYVSRRWTICELLRTIYILAENRGDAETMRLAHDCICYAKRMNTKLSEKDSKYAEGWFDAKKNRKKY